MATSSITANFYCDDAKAANAFVSMLAQPVRTVVRKKRSQTVVNDTTVDDADAFVKRFKARWSLVQGESAHEETLSLAY